jgi:hypothetical protein
MGGNINDMLKKKPNILFLILTKENHTIAVYSSLSDCRTMNMKESKGLLISTHSYKTYHLKKESNPITNDK